MAKILYLQNDSIDFLHLTQLLNQINAELIRISSNNIILQPQQLRSLQFETIIIDATIDTQNALRLLKILRDIQLIQPILTYTAKDNQNFYKTAIELGAHDILCKSIPIIKNCCTLQNSIKFYELLKKIIGTTHTSTQIDILDDVGKLKSFEKIDKEIISTVYDHTQGHISYMSRKLNIGRSTLYRKMKKYNII